MTTFHCMISNFWKKRQKKVFKIWLNWSKKSSIVDVWLISKYAFVNMTLQGFTWRKIKCEKCMYIKNKSCNILGACNFIKKKLQHGCVPVSIPKVLGTAFFIEQTQWLLLNFVLVSENNSWKRKLVEKLPQN